MEKRNKKSKPNRKPILMYIPYSQSVALILAGTMGVILTGVMMLGSFYTKENIFNYWPKILLNLGLNIVLFYLLFCYSFFISKKEWTTGKKYLWGIIGIIFITVIYMRVAMGVREWLDFDNSVVKWESVHLAKEALTSITVILISILLATITNRQKAIIEKEELVIENLQIRYDTLKNKLDPHFLFNSLNTLSGIVEENKLAQEYIEQLGDTYRYIINDRKLVQLKDELKFTEAYVFLMQIRYSNNLYFDWNIDTKMYDRWIIPISVQLLVENAIKHNVVSKKYPLTIHIYTTQNGTIKVSNCTCPLTEKKVSTGIGLNNLNTRYQILINNSININHNNNIFSVEIPLLTDNETQKIIKQFDI